jgi:hypothetical protein
MEVYPLPGVLSYLRGPRPCLGTCVAVTSGRGQGCFSAQEASQRRTPSPVCIGSPGVCGGPCCLFKDCVGN